MLKQAEPKRADFLLQQPIPIHNPEKASARSGEARQSSQVGGDSSLWLTTEGGIAPAAKCKLCQKTNSPYEAKGLCHKCYQKEWHKNHPNYNKKQCRRQHSLRAFDGKREKILKRDNFKCVLCESKKSLVVHHKDESGRIKKGRIAWEIKSNNHLNNLVTLCQSCHKKIHLGRLFLNHPPTPRTARQDDSPTPPLFVSIAGTGVRDKLGG